ncbi:MAG: HDIG domain-containing protein [Desulfobacterium sp.]|nr:HDIG domain-containing protein [Desulfobacterium sp.]
MNIPSPDQCLQLIEKMEMMSHIIDHSRMVQRVAKTLTHFLRQDNPHLNQELILAGAILHDITKTRSIATGERHAQTGGALLARLGYFEVGEIVRQHVVIDQTIDRNIDHNIITEAAIVNYADKRVLHDQVVPLEDRLSYILKRYGTSQRAVERIKLMWKDTILLEQALFKNLDITPASIRKHVLDLSWAINKLP